MLSHVTSCDQPLATMMLGLKVILSLCQYDMGLLIIYRSGAGEREGGRGRGEGRREGSYIVCVCRLIPDHIHGFAFILARLTETVK